MPLYDVYFSSCASIAIEADSLKDAKEKSKDFLDNNFEEMNERIIQSAREMGFQIVNVEEIEEN